MTLHVKQSGAWKTVAAPKIKVSGAWKAVAGVWVKVSGAWKQVFSGSPLSAPIDDIVDDFGTVPTTPAWTNSNSVTRVTADVITLSAADFSGIGTLQYQLNASGWNAIVNGGTISGSIGDSVQFRFKASGEGFVSVSLQVGGVTFDTFTIESIYVGA